MSIFAPSLPIPRAGETTDEFLDRLAPEERMRMEFRQVFRQLGAMLEADVRSSCPLYMAMQFWETIEGTFASAVMQYARAAEYAGARAERRRWEAEVDELRDALGTARAAIARATGTEG